MTSSEFVYTVLLRPRLLRAAANSALRALTPRTVKRHGATVVLNPNDPIISGALALGVYEVPETRVFLRLCSPGMTFLDIGANVGYYTALALARMRGQGEVISLEPDPESFLYLQQTVAANGHSLTTCLRKAASDHSGNATLFTSNDNRGDNRLYNNEFADGSCQVETVLVDDLLDEVHVNQVDLVKIDVQGFEGHVIAGMRRTIDRSSNLIILSEFWPHGLERAGTNPADYLGQMSDYGFDVYEFDHKGDLSSVTDHAALISRTFGRRYTNIVVGRRNAFARRSIFHA